MPVTSLEEEVEEYIRRYSQMWYTFRPRPDQPERYDEQTSAMESRHPGMTFIVGGNGAGTTTCAIMKALRFMIVEQEAPRPSTPFWFVAEGFPMVMDTVWNEKMCSRGMIPPEEVQWDQISWYKPRNNWPERVPLKPRPGSENNWVLEFKSYDQGRSKMQMSSIGGFVFCEQSPWELLTEVFRGSRDYDFRGNKIAEFTPINPALSVPLETMIQNGKFPETWGLYRMNTRCAMEQGHVSREWFNEFFGMVSEEMEETRMTGSFASYEGLIYPRFDFRAHVIADEEMDDRINDTMEHRRALDWGSGPENPMAAVYGAFDAVGTLHIYDEYYENDQSYTYSDHFNAIYEKRRWGDPLWYRGTYADPSDPGNIRSANRFQSDRGVWRSLKVEAAINRVLEGIEAVRNQLKIVHGEPRLLIAKRCKNLIREMQTYRWVKGTSDKRNPKDAPAQPLKKDDHLCDALRYLIMTHKHGGSGNMSARKIRPKNQKRFLRTSTDE